MKLYLLKNVHDASHIDLVPTMKEARRQINNLGGSEEVEIETIEIKSTAKAVCDFINNRFGVAIFEN